MAYFLPDLWAGKILDHLVVLSPNQVICTHFVLQFTYELNNNNSQEIIWVAIPERFVAFGKRCSKVNNMILHKTLLFSVFSVSLPLFLKKRRPYILCYKWKIKRLKDKKVFNLIGPIRLKTFLSFNIYLNCLKLKSFPSPFFRGVL